MALILIKDSDATHPDPVKNVRGCYKQGDIVDVYDDARHDGDLVANPVMPPFWLVRLVGASVADVRPYLTEEWTDVITPDGFVRRPLRKRAWGLDGARVPPSVVNRLNRDRFVEVDWATAQAWLARKAPL